MDNDRVQSRPPTPESPLTSSLSNATATVGELTTALVNYSRVPSPEPPTLLVCCCGKEDCHNTKAWLTFKSDLESRLTLSAQVGQALLQRHEAYVRRYKERNARHSDPHSKEMSEQYDTMATRVDQLEHEKSIFEKRLNQALVNSEVTEVSNKTLINELHDARTTISKLTALNARSIGWENKLSAAIEAKEDMQQERDSESHRAKVAEGRIAALKERTDKLQAEMRRLQEDMEQRRLHRLESSESILQDARARIEMLRDSQHEHTIMAEETEITKVLESLVGDNETLKRDNAELQKLLAESREDLHTLQEEFEDRRVNSPPNSGLETPRSRSHLYPINPSRGNIHASNPYRRNASAEPRSSRGYEPLTPEIDRRPLSPTDSEKMGSKWTAFSHHRTNYSISNVSVELESEGQHDIKFLNTEGTPHRTLFLLSRSCGVQTDDVPSLLSPSPLPSHMSSSPNDPRSESSSFSESQTSQFSAILERVVTLLHRLTQADAATLKSRLKRQHLHGADMGHLSRTTVSNILSEVGALRTHFRALLEDETITINCTRKDLRGLFKLFRDLFSEMGQIRLTLNDIIIDPSIAPKISEMALNPSKSHAKMADEALSASSSGGWMAPISKLFGAAALGDVPIVNRTGSPQRDSPSRPPTRAIPKLRPALAASTTTVNVEFSGTGVGRSITSTVPVQGSHQEDASTQRPSVATSQHSSSDVMGIFAGAPRVTPDTWVVVPAGRDQSRTGYLQPSPLSPIGFRRSPLRQDSNRLSRIVDAVIDVDSPAQDGEEPDVVAPLLQRTLRRRGLSDSSMHSTFNSHAEEEQSLPTSAGNLRQQMLPDRASVFQAFSRRVQSFRQTASSSLSIVASGPASISPSISEGEPSPAQSSRAPEATASSPISRSASTKSPPGSASMDIVGGLRASSSTATALFPELTSWVRAGAVVNQDAEPFYVGSRREQSLLQRTRDRGFM